MFTCLYEMLPRETDSHMYKIEAENIYEDFYRDKELFDFSNYQKDSKYYNNENKLVADRMMKHIPCLWKVFLGLKSKLYFFIT